MSWDFIFKLKLVFWMRNDSHCSLPVTVIYKGECECTLFSFVWEIVCFLFWYSVNHSFSLCVCEPATLLTYRTTVTV